MRRSFPAIVVLATFLLWPRPTTCRAGELEGVLRELGQCREAIKSLHHNYTVSTGPRDAATTIATETWELQTDAGRKHVTMTREAAKRADRIVAVTKVVSDGTHEWREMPIGQTVLVVKSKQMPVEEFASLRRLLVEGKARKRDSEVVAGESCIVIECVGEHDGHTQKSTFWVSKKHGLILRQLTESSDGQRREMITTSLEINKTVDTKIFAYAPPEGARVIDTLDMKPPK